MSDAPKKPFALMLQGQPLVPALTRQVRRHMERSGDLRTPEQQADDEQLRVNLEAFKTRRAGKETAEAASAARGKRNMYVCDVCFGHIITVDVDVGVAPFMLRCKATPNCDGDMQSSMYRVYDQRVRPSHEWYRPTPADALGMGGAVQEHIRKGGLILRKVAEN